MDAPRSHVIPPDRLATEGTPLDYEALRAPAVVVVFARAAGSAATAPQEVIDTLCRSHLFAGSIKPGRDTIKQLGKCHSQRLNEDLPAALDSCADTVGEESACLVDEINAATFALFEAVY